MGANIPSDLHDDIPSLTRWSFREFKDAYDAIFGLKNEKRTAVEDVKECLQDKAPDESDTTLKKTKGGSAIYEQFLPQSDGGAQIQMPPLGEWKLKSLPSNFFGETKELAESITRDIVRGNPDVNWNSIKGLDSAKHLLKEAVVMPIKYPQYFKGLLSPWKGILLFGPPGTGKTMLAKAVATECNTTFFNISASSIVSKWRGDSEKLVRVLFQVARHYAPSTIFLDEIDSIISHRGEANSEHEASRRLKTELLIQMDGLMKTDDLVFLLAATNLPWELDAAMLRRLEKRILVPLPDADARRAMFEELLSTSAGDDLPYDSMVNDTEGYSGSDLRIVCKEAAMRPLRRLMKELEKKGNPAPTEDLPEVGPITKKDVMEALKLTKPSAHLQAVRYEKFNNDYGSQAMED